MCDADLQELFKRLLNNDPELTGLDLRNRIIHNEGAESLAESLKNNTVLRCLSLRGNGIGARGIAAIWEGVELNNSLTDLNVRETSVADDGGKGLADAVGRTRTLKTLVLHYCEVGEKAAVQLGPDLALNRSLTDLDLGWNSIQDPGAEAIAKALRVHPNLTRLALSSNNIRDVGAKALADALLKNQALIELNLQMNEIGVAGEEALKRAVIANAKLEKVFGGGQLVWAVFKRREAARSRLDVDSAWTYAREALADDDVISLSILLNTNSHHFMSDDERPSKQDDEGNTLLHLALAAEAEKSVKTLLERGAVTRVYNLCGQSPIDVCNSRSLVHVVKTWLGQCDVMISYAHVNYKFACRVRDALKQVKIACWLDEMNETGIEAGTPWRAEIARGILRSEAVIFLASKESIKSEWCRKELALAHDKGIDIVCVMMEQDIRSRYDDELRALLDTHQSLLVDEVFVDFDSGMASLKSGLHRLLQSRNENQGHGHDDLDRRASIRMNAAVQDTPWCGPQKSAENPDLKMVFICHGDAHLSFSWRLAESFIQIGVSSYVDGRYEFSEDERMREATEAMGRCSVVVVVMSDKSCKSATFKAFIALAEDKKKPMVAVDLTNTTLPRSLQYTFSLSRFYSFYEDGLAFTPNVEMLKESLLAMLDIEPDGPDTDTAAGQEAEPDGKKEGGGRKGRKTPGMGRRAKAGDARRLEALQKEVVTLREELESCKFQLNEYHSRALKAESAVKSAQQQADLLGVQVKDYREELARIKAVAALSHNHSPSSRSLQPPADPPPLLPAIQGTSLPRPGPSAPTVLARQPSSISPRKPSVSPSSGSANANASTSFHKAFAAPPSEDQSPSRRDNSPMAVSLPPTDSSPAEPALASPRLFSSPPRSLRLLTDFAPADPPSPSAVPSSSTGRSTPRTLLDHSSRVRHPLLTSSVSAPANTQPLRPVVSSPSEADGEGASSTVARRDRSPCMERTSSCTSGTEYVPQVIQPLRQTRSHAPSEPLMLDDQLSPNGVWADALGPVTNAPASRDTVSAPDLLLAAPLGPVPHPHSLATTVTRPTGASGSDTEAVGRQAARARDGRAGTRSSPGQRIDVPASRAANVNANASGDRRADAAPSRRDLDTVGVVAQGWHGSSNGNAARGHQDPQRPRDRDGASVSDMSPEADSESDLLGVRGSHVSVHYKDQPGQPHPHHNQPHGSPSTQHTTTSPRPLLLSGLTIVSANGRFNDGAITDRNFRLPPNPNVSTRHRGNKPDMLPELREDLVTASQARDLGGWHTDRNGYGPPGPAAVRVRNFRPLDQQDILISDAAAAPAVHRVTSLSPARRPAPPARATLVRPDALQ